MPQRAALRRLLCQTLKYSGLERQPAFRDAEVRVVLVSSRRSAALNHRFLGHAGPTDVIAFALPSLAGRPPEAGSRCAGELYVNPAAALAAAPRHGHSAATELTLYLVHGLLHLAGHDDLIPAPRRRMRAAERRVMARLSREFDLDTIWEFGRET
ncbi:MAG: rRNA maturation RNase YbeY [bacterium]